MNYRYYLALLSINPQYFHKLIGPTYHYTPSLYTFYPTIYTTMSGRKQILPPPPHVEDEMDTTEHQVECFGA